MVSDFNEETPLQIDALSEKDRAVYRRLKKALAEKVKISAAADPMIEEKRARFSKKKEKAKAKKK